VHTTVCRTRAPRSAAISISTIDADRIRALTDERLIKPTSHRRARCRSAWQPNPGRRSTYRSGKSVRSTGATSRGGCDNARSVTSVEIEGRVLAALRRHLLEPDVIAEAVEAYRTERQRLGREATKSRNSTERDLAEIGRKIARLVEEIENGNGSKSVSQRIAELEGEREAGEARLAAFSSPEVVELHPRAAERYRQKVEDIQVALMAGDLASFEALALVRELVQSVRVVPTPRSEPVGLEITGDLAALLTVNEKGTSGMVTMVAGARFDRDLKCKC
jgi:site-specific DNA recombinase